MPGSYIRSVAVLSGNSPQPGYEDPPGWFALSLRVCNLLSWVIPFFLVINYFILIKYSTAFIKCQQGVYQC